MKTFAIIASLLLIAESAAVHADAIKCRGPDGKVFITDTVCPGNNRVDRVQRAEPVSLDRQIQAAEVNARASSQLRGIKAENAAWQEQHRRAAIASQRSMPIPQAAPRYEKPITAPAPKSRHSPAKPQEDEQFFVNGGGMMRKPAGSGFAYDDKGNAYHKPEGSAFSYGKGGKTCFHYGGFADCK